MKTLWTLAIVATLVTFSVVAFIWSGAYDIGADNPHWPITQRLLSLVREQSIRARSNELRGPDLADAGLIKVGAGNYDAMCVGCHLKPGLQSSELSMALYPAPPNLTLRRQGTPARDFWVIKHGIKMTGMPAWGRNMRDPYIWGMVAFLQKLPELTPESYATMVAASSGHTHGAHVSPASAGAEPGHDHALHSHTGSQHAPGQDTPAAGAMAEHTSPAAHAEQSRGTPVPAPQHEDHEDHEDHAH